jgi:PIN domain nuclease of toxin-antitoxin system
MKLLLDTHTFIWWDSASNRLPSSVLTLMTQPEHELIVSLASLWEIQIKTHLGKLQLHGNLSDIIQQQQTINNIILLPIALNHILELDQLPWHHRDPFDRLLIAQSRTEQAILITRDSIFQNYSCQTLWE